MKKLLFASACVATVAAFGAGAAYNFTGFEGIEAGTGNIGLLTDNGAPASSASSGFYWWYQDNIHNAIIPESAKDKSELIEDEDTINEIMGCGE